LIGFGFLQHQFGLGFGFYFPKTRFSVGFWVFSKLKKKMEIFRQNCDERRKKSKKTIQFFKLIAKHWAAMAGKALVPPKTNQNL
jgi:hypothetical protein